MPLSSNWPQPDVWATERLPAPTGGQYRTVWSIADFEAELLQKQTLLKPNDDSIRRLNRRRQNLIAYINQQTIGLLEGELVTAQSQLTSLSRPREVVLKHRELVRTALRDEKTLAELETQLQTLQLEKARQTDPGTDPTQPCRTTPLRPGKTHRGSRLTWRPCSWL